MNQVELAAALRFIQLEFVAWPSLEVSLRQGRCLWNLPSEIFQQALAALVRDGFLEQISGRFLRRGLGRHRRQLIPATKGASDAPSSATVDRSSGDRASTGARGASKPTDERAPVKPTV